VEILVACVDRFLWWDFGFSRHNRDSTPRRALRFSVFFGFFGKGKKNA
jgi:hypothetical protein